MVEYVRIVMNKGETNTSDLKFCFLAVDLKST